MWSWYAWATMAAWILLGIHPYINQRCQWCLSSLGDWRSLGTVRHHMKLHKDRFFLRFLLSAWGATFMFGIHQRQKRLWVQHCQYEPKPPLIHEAAGLIGPCSLLRLLVFDLGRLVGPWRLVSPRLKWIRCSVKLKGEPFGSDQMAPIGEGSVETGVKRETRCWTHCIHVWCLESYPACNWQFAAAKESTSLPNIFRVLA